VHTIASVIRGYDNQGNRQQRPFSLETDLAALDATLIELTQVELVIIDLGHIEVHRASKSLQDLAKRHDAAFVVVLPQIARSLASVTADYLVAADPEDPARCLFLPLQNNPARPQPGLAYRIEGVSVPSAAGRIETSRIVWDDAPVAMTADQIMKEERRRRII
jgi:hypothetical protein